MSRRRCHCPIRCQHCGAILRRDADGHYCPTKNCQWSLTGPGCPCDQPPKKEGKFHG